MEAGKNIVMYMGLIPGPKKTDEICGKTMVTGTMHRGSTVDHVLVNKMKSGMIQDVRTMRGPKCDSDHFLLKIKVKQSRIISPIKKK
jgi:hypothetical protein